MQKAFDLIVERLEELHKNYRNKYLFGKGNLRVLDGCQRGLEDAIEIANQVAEEYKQEVCEWKDNKASDYYKVGCQDFQFIHKRGANTFKYCPYCAKKIKEIKVI